MARRFLFVFLCTALAGCDSGMGEAMKVLKDSPGARDISVAKIQAQSAEDVARINAEAKVKLAQIQAEKEKYLAKQKADTEKALAQKAIETQRQQQEAENRRLSAELKAWRELHKPVMPKPGH